MKSHALLYVRKNGSNTLFSINIPAGDTGYFVVNKEVTTEKSNEITLYLDASENSHSQILEFTARVIAE